MTQSQENRPHPQAGQALRALREERGLSQEELARSIGCEVKAVRSWEQGKRLPQPANRRNLAERLGIDVKEIVTLIQSGMLEKKGAIFPPESVITQTGHQEQHVAESKKPDDHQEQAPQSNEASAGSELDLIFWYQAQLPNTQEFYGRVREREVLKRNIRKGISTSIIGPRRIGKTWLMSYIHKEHLAARAPLFCTIFLDATQPSCATQAGFINAALEVSGEPGWESGQEPASTYPNQGLLMLEKRIRKLRADNIIPLLCIDEFEGFCKHPKEFPADFFTQLRSVAQRGLVLVTASKEPLIEIVSRTGQTSPFFNIFDALYLQAFSAEEAKKFLKEKSTKARFFDEDQDHLLQVARDDGGRWPPARLQLAGQQLLTDKQFGDYRPNDLTYWQIFWERLEKVYQTTGS